MSLEFTTVFNALVLALLAALVLGVAWTYARRARAIARQDRTLPAGARAHGCSLTADPAGDAEALLPIGRPRGLEGTSRRLFEGVTASPRGAGELTHLMSRTSPEPAVWIAQYRTRHGHPARPAPKTALGQALGYAWGNAVATALPGSALPLMVAPRNRMRLSLWLHRRLRLRTGDRAFDRAFGVLGADADQMRLVLTGDVRRWLSEQDIPAKTVLVLEGGLCYAARHEPLLVETVPHRIELVTGFARRIPGSAWRG
ncbi:hypothetical protein [Glycomyces tenuis]|uniref:hypothetical protein n=1 Tax=Glycomyces tenuis TaxID=58116 RepID=UPI0003F6CF2F|nr:hypothetical protein [Glycomyces tenuis]